MVTSNFVKIDERSENINLHLFIAAPDKDIPASTRRPNKRGMLRMIAQLLAQATDVDVHGTVKSIPFDATSLIHDAVPAENAPAISNQQRKQFEFGPSQGEVASIDPGRSLCQVEFQGSDADSFSVFAWPTAPQNGLNPG